MDALFGLRLTLPFFFIALVSILFIAILLQKLKSQKTSNKANYEKYDYTHSYKSRPLLTPKESDAYFKLRNIAIEMNLHLFCKVRLFDLIEPKPGTQNYKGAQWKIQAKHVDFVLCNWDLSVRAIIELDDHSHTRADRKARDKFVDAVLTNTGYTIIHVNDIVAETLKPQLEKNND